MTPNKVCVLGNSGCSWKIAADLAAAGVDVLAAIREDEPLAQGPAVLEACGPRLTFLNRARLLAAAGGIGQFNLTFSAAGAEVRQTTAALVIAEAEERPPAFDRYGLKPAAGVISLSALAAGPAPAVKQALFLNGLADEGLPVTAAEVMTAALRLQAGPGARSIVLTRNLKVAGDGIEALSQEARAAGVVFFKFNRTTPAIRQDENGRVRAEFVDELTGETYSLAPDLTVVDEGFRPSAYTVELGRILGIESDGRGFIQTDNVRRLGVFTNRRGVLVAGGSRAGGQDPAAEAAGAALEALAALAEGPPPADQSALIDPGHCIRCLTCFRICPHRAVALNGRPAVLPAACERCGLCAAECPRGAIHMPGMAREEILRLLDSPKPAASPRIVAFCCRQSALLAGREAERRTKDPNAALTLVEIPCAGALPMEQILAAFNRGAEGVLVLTCHEDLCRSSVGNRFARARVEQAMAFMARAGLPPQRLVYRTLAANMAHEFGNIVAELDRSLLALRAGENAAAPVGHSTSNP
jgi:coenzyme F420-reducing hydrogenase delta subunit/NAD-dependent dihydropyrimidine dehydrogenase PreA subunit